MKLISQSSDLKAVSGGYVQDEFVTASTIFYKSIESAIRVGLVGGIFAGVGGIHLGGLYSAMAASLVGVALGTAGAAAGAWYGYNFNEYSDIEPNTWVRWDVTVVYY